MCDLENPAKFLPLLLKGACTTDTLAEGIRWLQHCNDQHPERERQIDRDRERAGSNLALATKNQLKPQGDSRAGNQRVWVELGDYLHHQKAKKKYMFFV